MPRALTLILMAFALAGPLARAQLPSGAQPLIYGGREAPNHSWMVALSYADYPAEEGFFCGGVLVGDRWVLTAAHCAMAYEIGDFVVVYGTADLETGAQSVEVERIYSLPHYWDYETELVGDLSLIQLSEPIGRAPIEIASQSPMPGDTGITLGWGAECTDCVSETRLREVELDVVDPSADEGFCIFRPLEVPDDVFILSGERTLGSTCSGDSGGPFIVWEDGRWKLAGITSYGNVGECLPSTTSGFIDVTYYRDWIESLMYEGVVKAEPVIAGYVETEGYSGSRWGNSLGNNRFTFTGPFAGELGVATLPREGILQSPLRLGGRSGSEDGHFNSALPRLDYEAGQTYEARFSADQEGRFLLTTRKLYDGLIRDGAYYLDFDYEDWGYVGGGDDYLYDVPLDRFYFYAPFSGEVRIDLSSFAELGLEVRAIGGSAVVPVSRERRNEYTLQVEGDTLYLLKVVPLDGDSLDYFDIYMESEAYDDMLDGAHRIAGYDATTWRFVVCSEWFGRFDIAAWPWVEHSELGWLYLTGSQDSLWAYDYKLGWWWTSRSHFPYFWSINRGWGWAWTKPAVQRWYYLFASDSWEREPLMDQSRKFATPRSDVRLHRRR